MRQREGTDARGDLASLEELEPRQIERALTATGGNRKEAAAKLGIGLRTACGPSTTS